MVSSVSRCSSGCVAAVQREFVACYSSGSFVSAGQRASCILPERFRLLAFHSIPSHIAHCTTLRLCGRCRSHLTRPFTFRLRPSVPPSNPPSIRPCYSSRELLFLPGAFREKTSRPTSKTHEPTFVHGDDRRLQTPRPSFACPAYLLRESRLILLRRLHRWLSFCLTSIPPI